MRLHHLKESSDYDVEEWLEQKLNLTSYQKEILRRDEIIRFAPFEFYERPKEKKPSFLWRLTILFYLIYLILVFVGLPFNFLFTGKWGYGKKFYDNFHSKWMRKLNL